LKFAAEFDYHQAMKPVEVEQAAVRSVQAFLQLQTDLAKAAAANCQAFAEQVTVENIFRLDAQYGFILGAASSLTKSGELLPEAYARYWKALSA
jgi:hypothetical protein